jgi:PAS domain S-box-containing protein
VVPFPGQSLRDKSGKVVQWYGANSVIEYRKRAEDALRASEQQFRLVIDNVPGLMSTLTAEGEVEFVNQRFLDYFGKTLEELKNWASSDVVHPDCLPRAGEALRSSLESGSRTTPSSVCAVPMAHIAGSSFCECQCEMQMTELFVGTSCFTDIDDNMRAEKESFARRKLESIGTLATGIAHDFNNLLGAVLAHADVALSELAAGVNPEEELRNIRDMVIRGSEIVRELMI